MNELFAYLNQFSERLDIEIDFFIDQINSNLDYISAYNRYENGNVNYIKNNPEKEEDFHKFAYDQYHSYFPYIVNSSLLITFDSYLDYKFYLLTESVSLKTQNNFNIKKSNGTYIFKCIDYFKDVLKIPISETDTNRISITNNHLIRNLIVHNNSCLLEKFTENLLFKDIPKIKMHKDYQLIKNCKYIDLEQLTGRFYITDNKLLLDYLKDIRSFLKTVIEQVFLVNNNVIKNQANQ